MKKTLLLLVALITATIAFAKTEINGIYYNLNNSTQTAEVTFQYQYSIDNYYGITSIIIPEKVTYNSTEYSVTSIGYAAFYRCSSLTSITIPNSVTSIGYDAFYNCSSLTSITIPNSVTSIGRDAFSGCSSLTSITIGNSVTSIGHNAFRDCSSLTSITIPNSVTSIGEYAFKYCSSLTSITIGNSVTSIGNSAFSGCNALTSITIPNSVTSIGDYAFSGCSSLTSITIEATTPPTLGTSAFKSTNLAAIYIPDNTLSAYKEAWGTDYNFANNENTLTIHVETPGTLSDKIFDAGQLPAFVTKLTVTGTLNDDDFTCMRETMTSLVDIDLSGITNTSGVYFSDKDNLLKILLPENLTSIGERAFDNCSFLTSITIPNSVTSIGDYAFNSCSSLISITISNSVTSIGDDAFADCSSLTSISIPNSVTSIGDGAFYFCSSLTSITIPNSVTSIGIAAFSYCESLTSITIPNSVTSIGDWAFRDCSSLTSITIPNSVTSIGIAAFYYCDALTSITCLGSTPPSANNLQAQYEACILFIPKGSLNDYQNHAEWGKFLNIQELEGEKYAITTVVNDESMGSVIGEGEYEKDSEITLTATANSGYRFAQWSDGNTDNPRIVTVTENKTYTAEFEVEVFGVYAAAAVPSMGGIKVILVAEPIEGLVFDHWSDGNTENPRTLTLTEDIELYAYFKVADATNVETSKISSANIYTTNGTLHIEGATENYHILDAAGRLIYSGNASTLTLPRGIYLVTMGGEVEKIVL